MTRKTLLMCALLLATVAGAQAPPIDGRGWYELGIKRHDAGDYKGASEAYEKARELNFFAPNFALRRVRVLTMAGEKEKAFALLQQMTTNGFANLTGLLGENELIALRT